MRRDKADERHETRLMAVNVEEIKLIMEGK
jgi:hypothetical protein